MQPNDYWLRKLCSTWSSTSTIINLTCVLLIVELDRSIRFNVLSASVNILQYSMVKAGESGKYEYTNKRADTSIYIKYFIWKHCIYYLDFIDIA